MSLKKNVLVSYFSQGYSLIVGVLIFPLYIKYMGAESYGLIGFFTTFQMWFNMLDLGLSASMSRETARLYGKSTDPVIFSQLFNSLQLIFCIIGIFSFLLIAIFSNEIVSSWLKIETLDFHDVVFVVKEMGICAALRWLSGLYRGILSGSEKLIWLGGFTIGINTLRFLFVLPIFYLFGASAIVFFSYQVCVCVIEVVSLFCKTRSELAMFLNGIQTSWSFKPIKDMSKFSITIAFTSFVWVALTQTDKLILSSLLPLSEYGYFTLAVLIASCILTMSSPISLAIMPRLARLEAESKHKELVDVYQKSTCLVVILGGVIACILIFCPQELLFLWTGDVSLCEKSYRVLRLYAIGNFFLVLNAFPYYLQYAKGNLRLHFIVNMLQLILLVPSLIFFTTRYGAEGAGYVWIVLNVIYFVFWVPFVHRRLLPGLHVFWLRDVLVLSFFMMVEGVIYSGLFLFEPIRLNCFITIVSFTLILAISAIVLRMILSVFNKEAGETDVYYVQKT